MSGEVAARAIRSGDSAPRRRPGPGLNLRGRFMLLLLAVVLPLGAVGIAVLRSAARSGETLLRERLDEALRLAVQSVGVSWVNHRSSLLDLADDPAVIAALRDGVPLEMRADGPEPALLERRWVALADVVDDVVLRDVAGAVRGSLERATRPGPGAPTVAVTLPVHDPVSGARLGGMEATVRLSALLPPGLWWAGVGGSVLALFDADGQPLLPLAMGPGLFARDRFDWDGAEWLVARHRLHDPALSFALAAPIDPFARPFARAARQGTLALIVMIAAGSLLATLLTRRMTGPLERLSLAADAVARGQLGRRAPEEGPHEIRRVARAFNTMTESLRRTLARLSQQQAAAAVGEFAAALAHEVRNPLTSVRLDLERARGRLPDDAPAAELVDRAIGQVERLDATVSDSLRVARSGGIRLEPLALDGPVSAAMHAALPDFEARNARLRLTGADPAGITVHGNAVAIEQILLNLLRNSAEALSAGGSAELHLEATPAGATLSVRDDGPGIPQEDLDHVVAPFYSTKAEGTGLGLPIARSLATAQDGELRIESAPGQGTTVRVTLPAAPDAPGRTPGENEDLPVTGADASRDAGDRRAPSTTRRTAPRQA